jgi:predicted ArsR family transcriptional regulator
VTTPNQILVDLLSGQATADSIAGRLKIPTRVIEAMLKRHAKDGLVVAGMINGTLTVYRLTTKGSETAISLRPPHAKRTASAAPATPEPIPA